MRARIIQLTDIHIGGEGEDTRGVDVRGQFRAALLDSLRLSPDHLVLSGDLCLKDGRADVYRWLKRVLDETGVPYTVMSGNHDNAQLIADAFELALEDGALCFEQTHAGRRLLFLDTTPHRLSLPQRERLARYLADCPTPPVVFMHHPPTLAGVKYMDERYPLLDHLDVWSIFEGSRRPTAVFVGHYHVERAVQSGYTTIYLTPSTYFQLDPESENFAIGHARPGYRVVDLGERSLKTWVRYVDASA